MIAAVFCTALATVAWNTGVNRLGIQTGGMWQNTVPVFAVLIFLIGEYVAPPAEAAAEEWKLTATRATVTPSAAPSAAGAGPAGGAGTSGRAREGGKAGPSAAPAL